VSFPGGPVPENPDVFWEMGQVAVNTTGDKLSVFGCSDPPFIEIDVAP
jgi:hypothetical protein